MSFYYTGEKKINLSISRVDKTLKVHTEKKTWKIWSLNDSFHILLQLFRFILDKQNHKSVKKSTY